MYEILVLVHKCLPRSWEWSFQFILNNDLLTKIADIDWDFESKKIVAVGAGGTLMAKVQRLILAY